MATWNKLNIDATKLNTDSTGATNKSLFMGAYPPGNANATAIAAIYGGSDKTVLDDPLTNASKIFFHTNYDYLKVKKVVNITVSLPARNVRSSGGGKKGANANTSFNGYADHYIYKHDYGSPAPLFTVSITGDTSNGVLANHGLTGSIPLQYASNNSFRLGLAYSTSEYLVIRERYQVFADSLPALTLKIRVYFFEQNSLLSPLSAMRVSHSPLMDDITSPYGWAYGYYRTLTSTYTFTPNLGATFNKVIIERTGGNPTSQNIYYNQYWWNTWITSINGTAVASFDPYTSPPGYMTTGNSGPKTYTYATQQSSWSFTFNTSSFVPGDRTNTPTYRVQFINTAANTGYTDYVGAVHRYVG